MATKFSFTNETFKKIKRAIAAGESYSHIGARYDLGSSTLTLINKSATFDDYKLLVRSMTSKRRVREATRGETRKIGVAVGFVVLVGIAVAELIVIIVLSAK